MKHNNMDMKEFQHRKLMFLLIFTGETKLLQAEPEDTRAYDDPSYVCHSPRCKSIQQENEELRSQVEKKTQQLEECEAKLRRAKEQLAQSLDAQQSLRQSMLEMVEDWNKPRLLSEMRNDDKMTKFYTGLPSWTILLILYDLCLPGAKALCGTNAEKCKLSFLEQFVLTLMRLRLFLREEDLAYRFRLSQSTVSRYVRRWVDVMYVRLARNFMVWPSREHLRMSMPMKFRKHFKNVVAIIDCFEIRVERPLNLLDRAGSFSWYKGTNTVKGAISITPQRTISWVSQMYGGRTTDVEITLDTKYVAVAEDGSFTGKLLPKDTVMADRGFLIAEELALLGVDLITPAFKGKRSQLTKKEVEESRRVSNVRIDVERVIGALKCYEILSNKIPFDFTRRDVDGLTYIDKIVFVCCCLYNAGMGC